MTGMKFFGSREGPFYRGESGVLISRDLTEDNRRATPGLLTIAGTSRSSTQEPSVSSWLNHSGRSGRWSHGESNTTTYIDQPGMPNSGRYHLFMSRGMYRGDIFFSLFVLGSLLVGATQSAWVDTFAFAPRAFEIGDPIFPLISLLLMVFVVVVLPNFSSYIGKKFGVPLGYSSKFERNAFGLWDAIRNIYDSTLGYMSTIFWTAKHHLESIWRSMIVGVEPRVPTDTIPQWKKTLGFFVGIASIPALIGLGILFGAAVPTTVAGLFTIKLAVSGGLAVAIILGSYLLKDYLATDIPIWMAVLVLAVAPFLAATSPVYIALAVLLGVLLAHRLTGRYITIPWLITNWVGVLAIAGMFLAVASLFTPLPWLWLPQFLISHFPALAGFLTPGSFGSVVTGFYAVGVAVSYTHLDAADE